MVLEVRGVSCAERPLAGDTKRQAGGYSRRCRIFAARDYLATLFGSYPSNRPCFFTVLYGIRVFLLTACQLSPVSSAAISLSRSPLLNFGLPRTLPFARARSRPAFVL
jgi:hypothetical protein